MHFDISFPIFLHYTFDETHTPELTEKLIHTDWPKWLIKVKHHFNCQITCVSEMLLPPFKLPRSYDIYIYICGSGHVMTTIVYMVKITVITRDSGKDFHIA